MKRKSCDNLLRNLWQSWNILVLIGFSAEIKQTEGVHHDPGYYNGADHSWDELELQFLSNLQDEKLHSNNYHVMRATFTGSENASYTIHISKTEELFHFDRLGLPNEEVQKMQCLYSGTITPTFHNSDSQQGIVSLSSCHYEHGFEGLILLPNEQYYIRPSASILSHIIKRSIDSGSKKPAIPHEVLKVDDMAKTQNSSNSSNVDAIHIPSLEDFENAKQYDQPSNETDDETNELTSTPEPVDLENETNESEMDPPNQNDIEAKPASNSFRKSLGKQSRRRKRPRPSQGQSNTRAQPQTKASTSSTPKVVEIAVFTDEKLYKVWKSRYSRDTTTRMNQYVLAVINNMNALYKQPSMTEDVTFRLVHLEVSTSRPSALNDNGGQATKYLKSFCAYAANKNQHGTLWDHALLLTGHDIHEGGSSGTAGIAWFSTMCLNSLSCSLIEGSTFASTFITSHEIGHSLGMEHDGSGVNSNCNANSHIMSPSTGGGKTAWSTCSMNNLRNYLSKGYNGLPAPKCITKKGSRAGNAINFGSSQLPGQQFNANDQCSAECKGCTPYTSSKSPYNDICHLLYCQIKTSAYYTTIRSTHPALEGTNCGGGRKCKFGKCK